MQKQQCVGFKRVDNAAVCAHVATLVATCVRVGRLATLAAMCACALVAALQALFASKEIRVDCGGLV